ncbi:hypothetical protein [uncultured Pseudomonas sp.]|uniref:hypothetical protein n=1 Tax=uncultured Pseudomonas sp. TaxID=114707 RepID=UPI002623889F|nr:hypothetical protein [uncultured Pseudomonas sp.]
MDALSRTTTLNPQLKQIALILSLSCWSIIFVVGAFLYQGSWYVYSSFSFIYLALLVSGVFIKVTYGYTFLTIILWLGFWLKTVVHLIFDYPFVEPTGLFNGSGPEWDHVFIVASLGALGVIIARLIYGCVFGKQSTMRSDTPILPPGWYSRYRVYLWCALASCIIIFAALNLFFSFQQIGLVPKTIIWPLNALFYWLLSTGFAMVVATLLWWEFCSNNNNINTIYFLLLEGVAASVSLLSRGLYIFHFVPLFFALLLNRKRLSGVDIKWTGILLASFLLTFLVCYPLVNSIRDYHYSGVPLTMPLNNAESWSDDESMLVKGFTKFAMFSVDRWVGLEGLMATSAYPDKNISLFISAATEKAVIGKASIFQDVALSHYRFMDLSKFVFASLPGPISFFYFSNSLWFVFIGMGVLTLLVLASEILIYRLLLNPLLAALWGSILATSFAQMGINVPGLIFFLFLCFIGFLTLYLIQCSFFVTTLFAGKFKKLQ